MMRMEEESYCSFTLWIFGVCYGIYILTLSFVLWIGCGAHDPMVYDAYGLWYGLIGAVVVFAFIIFTPQKKTEILLVLLFILCGMMYDDSIGYSWDNYCRLKEEIVKNATLKDLSEGSDYNYQFSKNIYVLPSTIEYVSGENGYYFAAAIVECPNGTSPENNTCPRFGEKVRCGGFAIASADSLTKNFTKWITSTMGSRLANPMETNFIDAAQLVITHHSHQLELATSYKQLLHWDDLDLLKEKWMNFAMGFFIAAILTPMLFIGGILMAGAGIFYIKSYCASDMSRI